MRLERTSCVGLVIGACLLVAGPLLAQTKDHRSMAERNQMLELTKSAAPSQGRVALAATWEAKEGEGEAVADILRRMASAVKSEPGTLLFWPHRSSTNDRVFFLYELFADDAAFAAHQQTDAFKTLVVGQALPKLARRERVQFTPFQHADASLAE
jgi:quinol monooxygenase YgiN